MIRNIIFDIGNVLVDFDWEGYIRGFHFDRETEERIAKATVLSPTWNEFDRGARTDEELIADFVKNDPQMEAGIRKICENIHDMLKRRDYAIPWIEEFKAKGYRVFYLSNFSRKAEVECADSLDFLTHLEGGILSYQEKVIKPEPEIYNLLMERYNLIPEECVFMDDRSDNCEGAEALGIHAIVFHTKEQAEEALKKLGVH